MRKNKNREVSPWSIAFALPLLLTLLLASSCSHKTAFNKSTVVPAAEGTVKVKKDKNDNYNIDVRVNRLAKPDRLTPAKDVYVVWMVTEHNGTRNIGQLKSSSGMFSSALKSSLNTVSAYKPERIFITAEDDAALTYPTGQQVLETKDF